MSIHIEADFGEIAETVLLPGDPLRAKFIAENYFEDVIQYNNVRGMLGYTGTYKGKRVSTQGTGMGMPSISIYVHELITEYNVRNLIRVGTCGSFQPHIKLRDIVIAMTSSTDSAINKNIFKGMDFAPTADFQMLQKAVKGMEERGIDPHVGNILTSDVFYGEDPDEWKKWAKYGVLAVEMETTALYTIAAQLRAKALTILTVSDSLVTSDETSSEERETSFTDMIEVALDVAVS